MKQQQHSLPLLGPIAGLIRWVEELANLVSGPLLTLGLGIALVDLLTDGSLLTRIPALLYTWAITQAVGVDAQLVATWDRARQAMREHRFWAMFALVVLGAVLAYVAWVAAQVFALQQSEGVTTQAALDGLGFDPAVWLVQRTALSVFLVCLAGWTRYHPPVADVAGDVEAERAKLEASLTLEPLRQQLRAQQVRGLRSVAASALGKDTGKDAPANTFVPTIGTAQLTPSEPTRPPTGGGSPMKQRPHSAGVRTPGKRGANVVRLRNLSVEDKARAAWQPGISVNALQRTAHIGRASAQKYHAMLTAEQHTQEAVQ